MYPRTVLLLLVGALVITAGCVDGLGGLGPADVAGTDDATGADESGGSASDDGDGASDDGATDGDSASGGDGSGDDGATERNEHGLVENRTAVLRDAGSYTGVWEMTSTVDGDVESVTAYTTAVDYATERSSFSMRQTSGDQTASDVEQYHADGVTYARYGSGADATYNVNDRGFAPGQTLFPVQSWVADNDLEEFTAVGAETFDGVGVTRYERTEQPVWLAGQAADGEVTWTEFTYVVLVDDDGLVRSERWGGEGVDDEDLTRAIEFSYSLTGVGATAVDEPDWVATARDENEA